MKRGQQGLSLIEVLVSVLILAIGLLGAAAIQLNALKYTDSSTMNTQASFIAYDMMDRIRANPDAAYGLASLDSAPTSGSFSAPVTQDLYDFATNIKAIGGTAATIVKNGYVYTITITWNDVRAVSAANQVNSGSATTSQTFTLSSRVAADAVTK